MLFHSCWTHLSNPSLLPDVISEHLNLDYWISTVFPLLNSHSDVWQSSKSHNSIPITVSNFQNTLYTLFHKAIPKARHSCCTLTATTSPPFLQTRKKNPWRRDLTLNTNDRAKALTSVFLIPRFMGCSLPYVPFHLILSSVKSTWLNQIFYIGVVYFVRPNLLIRADQNSWKIIRALTTSFNWIIIMICAALERQWNRLTNGAN